VANKLIKFDLNRESNLQLLSVVLLCELHDPSYVLNEDVVSGDNYAAIRNMMRRGWALTPAGMAVAALSQVTRLSFIHGMGS
jgi:hypothetical protein